MAVENSFIDLLYQATPRASIKRLVEKPFTIAPFLIAFLIMLAEQYFAGIGILLPLVDLILQLPSSKFASSPPLSFIRMRHSVGTCLHFGIALPLLLSL